MTIRPEETRLQGREATLFHAHAISLPQSFYDTITERYNTLVRTLRQGTYLSSLFPGFRNALGA